MKPNYFAIFYVKNQIAEVFNVNNYRLLLVLIYLKSILNQNLFYRKPEYIFKFSKKVEQTVCLCWTNDSLYSLTKCGVVSKWKLGKNGRKKRESIIMLNLENCKQMFAISAKVSNSYNFLLRIFNVS